jgi:hypothetical protein
MSGLASGRPGPFSTTFRAKRQPIGGQEQLIVHGLEAHQAVGDGDEQGLQDSVSFERGQNDGLGIA